MNYSVQPNEMMGFLNMLTANDRQQGKWASVIPELNNVDFKELAASISQNTILNPDFFKGIAPENYSLTDFRRCIPENYTENLETAYKAYHSFYEKSGIENYAEQIEKTINSLGQDSFKQMAQFYGLENADNHTTAAYAVPSIDGSGSCSLSGQEKSFQLFTLKMPVDENTDIKKDVSKLFHETAHGIFEDSGSEKVLNDYIDVNPDNPISQLMKDKPHLKRHETDDAKLMINEFMTTAFQKIFTHDALQKETSYDDPTIAIMAEKLVPQIRDAIENDQTFNESFIKRVEKTFVEAVPEIEKEIAQKHEEMVAKKIAEKFLRTVFQKNGMELTGAFWGNPDNLKTLKSMLPSFKGIDPNQEIDEQFIEKVKKEHPSEFEAITRSSEKDSTKKEEKSSLFSTLSEAKKEGKNDPRNETKESQPITEKKTTFPKWLKNPPYLLQGRK